MTEYRGRVWIDHWHDGDTFYGVIDPGWGITLGGDQTKLERIRMAGINAPELMFNNAATIESPDGTVKHVASTPNPAGQAAYAYANTIAPALRFYDYVGHNRDKYGRPLLDIFVPASKAHGTDFGWFSARMLRSGHAVVMKG